MPPQKPSSPQPDFIPAQPDFIPAEAPQEQAHSYYNTGPPKVPEPPQTFAQKAIGFGKDVGKGLLESGGGTAYTLGAPVAWAAHKMGLANETPEQQKQQENLFKPANATQAVAAGAGDAAQAMVPVERAIPLLGKLVEALPIPTRAKAGKLFQQVMEKAGNEPIHLSNSMEPLTEAQALMKSGGGSNTPVRDLITRLDKFNEGPLTYQQARRFAPNLSRTSVSDTMGMSPTLQRQVGKVSSAFNEDVAAAAERAGVGAEHAKAMQTYARAMKARETLGAIGSKARKAIPYVAYPAGGYLGYKVVNELLPK